MNRLQELLRPIAARRPIPSLDGLRAISILFVLLAHLTGTHNFPLASGPSLELGHFGVRVFFVISGYLITSILLAETRQTGGISLPRFYFRRTMRLFPASYFLIAVVASLSWLGQVQLQRWDLAFAAGYGMNFHVDRGWYLGHLWSLAVEEQFYVIWPLTLKLLGPNRASKVLLATLVVAPLSRLASPYAGAAVGFLVSSDSLATGCLLALWREKLQEDARYRRLLESGLFFLVPLAALAANYVPSTKVRWLVSETVMNVGIAITSDWAIRNPGSQFGRFLNWAPVSFIGVLSYSLYLWQQMFLNRSSDSPLAAFPLNLGLAVLLALASFLLVEEPFLRLRSRMEKVWFPKGKGGH